jgi:DNA-binding CsgD family transcriptional regulator
MAGATDLSLFWEALVVLLQDVVPHDTTFLWYDYFDFATSSLATRVFEAPQRDRSGAYWESRRRHHPTPQYLQEHPGTILHRVSDIAPVEQIRTTAFYRRFMQPEGWEHGVTLAFWQKGVTRATLVLYRTATQGDFTDRKCASLESLHPLIEAVLFRMIDQHQQQAVQDTIGDFVRGLPIGLILLNWDLQPVYVNDAGYAQALMWNHGLRRHLDARADFLIPADLQQACERFRDAWLQHHGAQAMDACVQKIQHAGTAELKAIVSMQQVRSVSALRPIFLIRFSGLATRGRTTFDFSETQLKVLAQLTPAEREITLLVRQGLSNQQIATRLHREVCTVKDHLHHIYRKLDVRSRTQLASALLEGLAGSPGPGDEDDT